MNASSGTLAIAFNTTNETFQALNTSNYNSYTHLIGFNVTAITNLTTYYIDVYSNGVFNQSFTGTTTSGNPNQFNLIVSDEMILNFKMRSVGSTTLTLNFTYTRTYYNEVTTFMVTETGFSNNATVTTTGFTNLSSLAPDLKVVDFVSGICKEFNLTVYSNTKNVFTFDPIQYWYSKGIISDITQFTDVTSIEIERMKLYKSIEFKYQDSECMLNKYFLESPLNADAHGYGNVKIGWNYDGGEYKIESPF